MIPSPKNRHRIPKGRKLIEEIKHLVMMGFAVHRLHPQSKRPVGDDWSKLPVATYSQLKNKYHDGENVGVRLGKWSKIDGYYLHAIDMDVRVADEADEAEAALEKLFPGVKVWKLPRVISGSGGASLHIYFVTDEPFPSKKLANSGKKFTDAEGRKHWTWELELFGTGKQVALPPSIHPDTGKCYKWDLPFDPTDKPPHIDADLIARLVYGEDEYVEYENEVMGISYEDAEEYLKDLDLDYWCEDRVGWITVAMALHHEFNGSEDAFDVWCDFSKQSRKFDRDVCEEQWDSIKDKAERPVTFRTIVQAANEFRQAEIYDAIPGEFEDDQDDEHDISNEFDDLEDDDDGDENGVVKTDTLPIEEPGRGEDDIANEFEDLPPYDPNLPDVPRRLLRIPGKLQLAVDFYNATAVKPQPQFAVQTALGIGSVILSRQYITDENNMTSLYFLNLVETASGKEQVDKVATKLIEAAGLDLVGPDEFTSDAGVTSALLDQPRCLSIIDEFSHFLVGIKGADSGIRNSVQTYLLKIYNKLESKAHRKSYSSHGLSKTQREDAKNRQVVMPALTILSMAVPGHFYESLSMTEVRNGFLNRFLIVASPIAFPKGNSREMRKAASKIKPHPKLIDWMKHYGQDRGEWDRMSEEAIAAPGLSGVTPELIPYDEECASMLEQMEDDVAILLEEYRAFQLEGLFGRTREMAMRIALIVALSCDSDMIKLHHLRWARDYVFFYQKRSAALIRQKLGKSEMGEIAEFLVEKIKKAGRKGLTMAMMAHGSRRVDVLKKRDIEELEFRLERLGVSKVARKSGKKGGRPTEHFVIKQRENDDDDE